MYETSLFFFIVTDNFLGFTKLNMKILQLPRPVHKCMFLCFFNRFILILCKKHDVIKLEFQEM